MSENVSEKWSSLEEIPYILGLAKILYIFGFPIKNYLHIKLEGFGSLRKAKLMHGYVRGMKMPLGGKGI